MVVFGCTFYFIARELMTQDPEENYQKRMARQYPKHVPGHFQPKG